MSKLQFITLLSPAVGSFVLVILAWMQANVRLADQKENTNLRFAELQRDMDRQFDRMDARMDRIENDQKQFFNVTGKLDGRIDEIARR